MKRVTGLGGFFFKVKDRKKMADWYSKHLGLNVEDWGGAIFPWLDKENPQKEGMTLWSTFADSTDYFNPSSKDFMINYRVENLEELVKVLEAEGVERIGGLEDSEYGKFAWFLDPEGNKLELWEAPQ